MGSRSAMALLVVALAVTGPVHASAEPLGCTRALLERLGRSGRAEAGIVQSAEGPIGADRQRGRIVLEPPDRLRLDYPATGERLTVRRDGGEWLQPAARQMLILRPEQAQRAARTWRVLQGAGSGLFEERRLGEQNFALVARSGGNTLAESLWVALGPDGYPAKLEVRSGDVRWIWRFSGWRFARPRGPNAFTLRAPTGFAVVEMP